MEFRLNLQNAALEDPCYYKDVSLSFLPVIEMNLVLGTLPDGDIVGGSVTSLEHDFRTGVTYVTCLINEKDEKMDEFAQHNQWMKGYG